MNTDLLNAISDLLDKKLEPIKAQLEPIKAQLDEHTQILRALEHSAQVNKAEHDKMSNDIAHIKGDVEAIKKDITNVEVITASNWADIAKLKAVK